MRSIQTSWQLFCTVFRHEGKVLFADRTLWLVGGLLAALLSYALFNGLAHTQARADAAAVVLKRQVDQQASNIDLLARMMAGKATPEPFANPADPASIGSGMGGRYAVLPAAALAPVAVGQSDMFSHYYQVTYRSKLNFMYDSEIENPWNLLSGHFDLAFVVVYLLPLLIFALSYNLLSAEREQGTLRMLLSQPLGLPVLVAAKLAVRAVVVVGIANLLPVLVLMLLRPEVSQLTSLPMLLAWASLVASYALFWFLLCAAVNAIGRSSAANALMLIGGWVMLVLVVPVVLNLVVGLVSPAPSRTELATRTRLITIDGLNRYNKLLSTDYRYIDKPEVLIPKNGKIEVPPRRQGAYMLQRDVDSAIQPVLDQFDAQLAGQQALVERFGFLSPAIVAHEGMAALAGNGSRRYLQLQNQVSDFHALWKQFFEPRMLTGTAIVEADFERMPRFEWQEAPAGDLRRDSLLRLVQLLTLTVLLAGFTAWRLRRYPAV
jgi:ABC-2 type transport system permease protein